MDLGWMVVFGVVIAIALLASAVGLVWLRASATAQAGRRAERILRVRRLNQEFSGLARRQPANPGEPYASRLAQVNQELRRGWERVRQAEAQLRESPPTIPARPLWQLLVILPLYAELSLRLREWWAVARQADQLERAEAELGRARRGLDEIAGLGRQEQVEVDRVQAEISHLRADLAAHRLSAALASEQEKLDGLGARLEQTAAQFGAGELAPAQVAAIHPERRQIEQELRAIHAALHSHETSQARLRPRLDRQRQRLEAFEQALAAEEEGRRPAPLLRERCLGVRQALEQLEEALLKGDYGAVEPGLATLGARQKDLEETLKKLSGLRERLSAAQDETGAALSGLRQWIRQFPAPFVLDVAQEQARGLQARLQDQARAAASEDPAELERAAQASLGEIRKAQSDFERSLEIYQRLAPQLSPEMIEGLQKRGEHLAARLKLRHPAYHEKARLPALEENIRRLAESWQQIGAADPNRQSELIQAGQALQQLESAWNGLERGAQRAFEVLEQAKTQQERTAARLGEEVFNQLAALAETDDPEWAPVAAGLLEQRRPLVERAGRGDEDFGLLLAESEALYKEALKRIKEYQVRLVRAQAETARLVDLLNGCADRMEMLLIHPYLDFKEQVVLPLDDIRRWLGQAQLQVARLLPDWDALVAAGAELHQEVEGLCRAGESQAIAAAQERAWTEDMLATAEELLGSARQHQPANTFNGELTAARNSLEMARRKLNALASPRRKYALDEYQAELVDVREMISGARTHIDHMLA